MNISVVIATCNRKSRLLSLIGCLDQSTFPLNEVIIVDSGEHPLQPADFASATGLNIRYLRTEKSVCLQRNTGIRAATSPWIFICDDDIEVPGDYLQKLTDHIRAYPDTGAVSGLVLQWEKNGWTAEYPEHSATAVCWKFIFQLSIWGSIRCKRNNFLFNKIRRYYHQKGNHISKAGWPVITDFSGDYFSSPVYGLGASLIKKEWLRQTPFDEVLDSHGIGDNYGAAMGFPGNISILNQAWVYHHRDNSNRLDQPLQYFRRALALGYFIQTKERLRNARVPWLLWSLTGSLVRFMLTGDLGMTKAAMVSIIRIACRRNPYVLAARARAKITEPKL